MATNVSQNVLSKVTNNEQQISLLNSTRIENNPLKLKLQPHHSKLRQQTWQLPVQIYDWRDAFSLKLFVQPTYQKRDFLEISFN